jgi:hypothetical protein
MQNQRNHPDDRWRAEARERQRLHRQRLRDGLHPVMLVLPDIVWAAWRVRERVLTVGTHVAEVSTQKIINSGKNLG